MIKENNLLVIISLAITLIILSGCQSQLEDKKISQKELPPLGSPIPTDLTPEQQKEAEQTPEGMVYVPEGNYISGIPTDSNKDGKAESKGTTIWLSPYYFDKYEVTNKQFAAFIATNNEWKPGAVSLKMQDGHYLNEFDGLTVSSGREEYPVVWVSWYAADAFCKSAGKRLPTAAEWEKAGRGTDGRLYPWGDVFDGTLANLCDKNCEVFYHADWDDGFAESAPVGSLLKGASPYGVMDMIGNVGEWVADGANNTKSFLGKGQTRDPKGPETSIWKIVFGRAWSDPGSVGYQIYRNSLARPEATSAQVGFRCAADAKE